MMAKPRVIIYSDGGASPNPGPGGWGVLLIDPARPGREVELSGSEAATTNNRMELRAAVEALRALKTACVVDFYVDSQYVQKGITEWLPLWIARGWQTKRKQPVKNQDLWEALSREAQCHDITWHWVRGHSGNPHNERVDHLATAARHNLTGHTSN